MQCINCRQKAVNVNFEVWMFKVVIIGKQRLGALCKSAHGACLSSEMAHAPEMVQKMAVVLDFFPPELCNFLFDVSYKSDYTSWLLTGVESFWSCFDVVVTIGCNFESSKFYHKAFFRDTQFCSILRCFLCQSFTIGLQEGERKKTLLKNQLLE